MTNSVQHALADTIRAERATNPAYERTKTCPSWCEEHEWFDRILEDGTHVYDVLAGHARTLTRGEVRVVLSVDDGSQQEARVDTGEYEWLNGQDLADYAALLMQAHEILEAEASGQS